jgi:hypothetical protein
LLIAASGNLFAGEKTGRNGLLLMPGWHFEISYYFLILGVISLSAAVLWTCTGKARTARHGWVYRAEEATDFWFTVAMYYFTGVLSIGIFLYKVYGLSN